MKLLKLNISNFGLFHNKKIEFSEGLNLIYGRNESGKSTIHTFIKGILFGIEKTRGRSYANEIYDKFQPWDTPGSYDGSIEFKVNNNTYHIYRNFEKNSKKTLLTGTDTGRSLKFSQIEFQELINGLTRSAYDGTISIEQLKAKTDEDLLYHVQNHITNLKMSRSEEIDIKKALDNLKDKGKRYGFKALKEEIEAVEQDIKEGERIEQNINNFAKQISDIELEEEKLLTIKKELINNENLTYTIHAYEEKKLLIAKFPVIKTKYGYYLENLDQSNQLKENIIKVQDNKSKQYFTSISKTQSQTEEIKADIENIKNHKNNHRAINKTREEDKKRYKDAREKDRRKSLLIVSPFLISGLAFIIMFFAKDNFLITTGIFLVIIGIIITIVFAFNNSKKGKRYQAKALVHEESLKNIEDKILAILNKYNVGSEYEIQDKYEEILKEYIMLNQQEKELQNYQNEYIQLQERIKNLRSEIIDYIKNFTFADSTIDLSNGELLDEAIGQIDEYVTDETIKINEYEENIKPKLSELSIKKEKIYWEIELLEANEEKLLANQEKYSDLLTREEDYKREADSINLAISTIEEISTSIHDSFGSNLNNLVSEITKNITNGKYKDIKVDEKLKIKTEVEDRYHYLESFSEGTIEQFYFSLRLAIADLIYGKGQVPILLDDTFAYYDDQRLRSTLKMFSEDKERQILLFTCHEREKNVLDSLEAPYHYIEL